MTDPLVSVVIPARNAASTLVETLDALATQTMPRFEAIIVDDGSADATASIAEDRAAADERFRMVGVDLGSEGGARNAGLAVARAPWVLFLDADDLIEPPTLQRVAARIEADRSLDGVVYGWSVCDERALPVLYQHWNDRRDPFEIATRHTPFPVHACVIRRSLVEEVGGFDPGLRGGADWDLWIRIFRMGPRLARIGEVLARYRSHPGTASRDARTMFAHTLSVIERAYRPDPRVAAPQAGYARGGQPEALVPTVLVHLCWWTGVAIGAGQPIDGPDADAMAFLDGRTPGPVDRRRFDAQTAALALEEAIRSIGPHPPAAWPEVRGRVWARVTEALERIERVAPIPHLAEDAAALLDAPSAPREVGDVFTVDVELTQPLPPVAARSEHRVVRCIVRLDGRPLGFAEAPVIDGAVDDAVLGDTLAARFWWDVGRHRMERTRRIGPDADESAIWRAFVAEASPGSDVAEAFIVLARDVLIGSVGVPSVGTLVGRRRIGGPGTAAARWARLPAACATDAVDAARAAGESVSVGAEPGPVACVPEFGGHRPLPISVRGRIRTRPIASSTSRRVAILRYDIDALPGRLEEHVRHLVASGFRTPSWDEWDACRRKDVPLEGRVVYLAFEGSVERFLHTAWPVIRRARLRATLLADLDDPCTSATWRKVRRAMRKGLDVGWRAREDADLVRLSIDASRARGALTRATERPVAIAGSNDLDASDARLHVVGACGYVIRLGGRPGIATHRELLLDLPCVRASADEDGTALLRKATV